MLTVVYVSPFRRQKNKVNSKNTPNTVLQINPYMSNPCHIELILTEGDEVVAKSEEVAGRETLRLNARQRAARTRKAITAA